MWDGEQKEIEKMQQDSNTIIGHCRHTPEYIIDMIKVARLQNCMIGAELMPDAFVRIEIFCKTILQTDIDLVNTFISNIAKSHVNTAITEDRIKRMKRDGKGIVEVETKWVLSFKSKN